MAVPAFSIVFFHFERGSQGWDPKPKYIAITAAISSQPVHDRVTCFFLNVCILICLCAIVQKNCITVNFSA